MTTTEELYDRVGRALEDCTMDVRIEDAAVRIRLGPDIARNIVEVIAPLL